MAVTEILETLRLEESRVVEEGKKLKASLKANKAELKQVRAALSALGAKPGSSGRQPARRAVTQADVIAAMTVVLADGSVVETEDLKKLVQKELSNSSKSLQGYALRFAEAIKEEQFIDTPAGLRLVDADAIVLEA